MGYFLCPSTTNSLLKLFAADLSKKVSEEKETKIYKETKKETPLERVPALQKCQHINFDQPKISFKGLSKIVSSPRTTFNFLSKVGNGPHSINCRGGNVFGVKCSENKCSRCFECRGRHQLWRIHGSHPWFP